MSRRTVSNHTQLHQLVTRAVGVGKPAIHRILVVVEDAPVQWLEHYAAGYQETFVAARSAADRTDRINAVLGQEFSCLIHDTGHTIDAGLLMALAGTVKAGGVLIVGMTLRQTDGQLDRSRFKSRFTRLLTQMSDAHPDHIIVARFDAAVGVNQNPQSDNPSTSQRQPEHRVSANNPPVNPSARDEQNVLVSQARHFMTTHTSGTIVIRGRRGRGKSTLLARLAKHFINDKRTFHLTSARRSALSTVEQYCPEALTRYIAPAEVFNRRHTGTEALLVDEAASLSLSRLSSIVQCYPLTVLCTTTEGYESAGRAFDIRLMDQLRQRPQALLDLCPNHVWRWQPEDPLETFLDLLMLSHPANSTPQQPVNNHTETTTLGHRARCTIKRLDRHALAKNDTLLRDVYSLLRLYHYQNSALDLAHILDAENVQIWVAEQQTYNANQIVAALMLGIEGNIDQTLHEPIMARERRPAHQLLPQLLAQMANSPTALGERYARIIRIAVLPDSRRQAIGTQLLTELRQRLSNLDTPITTLGASFAGDTHSTQFWRANGYIEFHRGFRSNPRTGKRSVAVIRSDNQNVQRSIQQAVSILADNQDQLVKLDQANTFSGQLQVQATNQVTSLLEQHPVQQSTQPPTDLALLHRYVRGHRSAHDTAAALVRFCCLHNETALLSALKTTGVTADTHSPRPSRRSQESTLRKCIERHLFGQTGHGNEP